MKPRPISDLRYFAASPGHRPEIVGALCLPELCFFLHLACHSVGQGATQGVHGMPRQLLQLGGPAPQMRLALLFYICMQSTVGCNPVARRAIRQVQDYVWPETCAVINGLLRHRCRKLIYV